MIQPLRRAHRGIFLVLAVGLPIILVLAIALRTESPTIEAGGWAPSGHLGTRRR